MRDPDRQKPRRWLRYAFLAIANATVLALLIQKVGWVALWLPPVIWIAMMIGNRLGDRIAARLYPNPTHADTSD
jgi:uncharacterized membrane protein YfcA